MSDYRHDYWREAISCSLDDLPLGRVKRWLLSWILAGPMLDEIADGLKADADNQSMAFGWDVASSNLSANEKRERDDVRAERDRLREEHAILCDEIARRAGVYGRNVKIRNGRVTTCG